MARGDHHTESVFPSIISSPVAALWVCFNWKGKRVPSDHSNCWKKNRRGETHCGWFHVVVSRLAARDGLSMHIGPDKAIAYDGVLMADSRRWGS